MHKAQALPTYIQPIQSIVSRGLKIQRAWFGGGEREKIYFEGFGSSSFGEMFYWDDLLPKRGKLSWNH